MTYDVVIIGGGTSGCAVAYTLGKAGKKVLLVEKSINLGGTMTSGLVTPMMKTSKKSINNDFFNVFIQKMKDYNSAITYIDSNEGWFNPEIAKIVLDELMQEANVEVKFETILRNVNIASRYIKSIELECNMLLVSIGAKYIIDATGNCDVGFLSNCNFINKDNENQPTTLRFIMSGVDLDKLGKWIESYDNDRNVTTVANINNQIHLSTAYTWDLNKKWALKPLFDKAVADRVIEDTDRNYFQLFSIAGMPNSIAFNCPRIIADKAENPLNSDVISKNLMLARKSILRLSNFCRKYLVGFENAYISSMSSVLGVRVSRRIKGKYIYTYDDIKNSKKFKNPVLVSDYPVDVHSTDKNASILEQLYAEYQLPVESLMSADIDNLFVVGRCISADFMAQGAIRIIPSCFSMGEGLAKYMLKNL